MNLIEFPITDLVGHHQLTKLEGHIPAPDLATGPWIAGGVLNRIANDQPFWVNGIGVEGAKKPGDIDYFFANEMQFNAAVGFMIMRYGVGSLRISTENAVTFSVVIGEQGYDVQFIRKWMFDDIAGIYNMFDFTATQATTDFKTVVANEGAVEDMMEYRLRIAKDGRIGTATYFKRVFKYCANGYDPQPGVMAAIATMPQVAFEEALNDCINGIWDY